MNREIKFRAWHKDQKKMIYFDNEKASRYKNSVIMQFTGLKDSEDKDIYEGDILKVLMTDWISKSDDDDRTLEEYKSDLSKKYTVGFKRGSFMMSLNDNGKLNYPIFCGTHGFIKVTGNIFESRNPSRKRLG